MLTNEDLPLWWSPCFLHVFGVVFFIFLSGECVDWSVKSKPWTEDKSEKWCIQVSVLTRLHYNLSFLKLCQLEYIFDPAVVKGMILVWKSVTFSAITLTLDISNCQDLEDVASLLAASIYKFWPKRVRGLNILSLSPCVCIHGWKHTG